MTHQLPHSFFIGLAPMVDYTYLPFRLLCRSLGADITFTEMIVPLALVKGNSETIRLHTMTVPEERPIGIQLLATTSNEIHDALNFLESSHLYRQFDVVDLNFGCPSTKVQQMNAGASLLKPDQLETFENIIRTAVEQSPLPVTVKMRLGHDQITIFEALKRIADLNDDLAWITVHLRLAIEKRKGDPHFDLLPQIIETTAFKIVANGNLWTPERITWAKDLGSAGVLIGRKARSSPEIFMKLKSHLVGKEPTHLPDKIEIYHWLLKLHQKHVNEMNCFVYMKRLATELLKGIPGGRSLRQAIQKITTLDELTIFFRSALES